MYNYNDIDDDIIATISLEMIENREYDIKDILKILDNLENECARSLLMNFHLMYSDCAYCDKPKVETIHFDLGYIYDLLKFKGEEYGITKVVKGITTKFKLKY